jgi:hypothetical protein
MVCTSVGVVEGANVKWAGNRQRAPSRPDLQIGNSNSEGIGSRIEREGGGDYSGHYTRTRTK